MTYGVNAPLGLQAATYGNSAPWSGGFQVFPITAAYATSLFLGDLVTLTNGQLVRFTVGGGAANPPIGVFWGCTFIDAQGVVQIQKYWPASTTVKANTVPYANVITDPNTFFTIQANGVVTAAQLTSNADVSFATAGSTSTGESGMMLDIATFATTATLPLHVVAFDTVPGNAPAVGSTSQAYANVIVKLNNTMFSAGATGV